MTELVVPDRLAKSNESERYSPPYGLIGTATTFAVALATSALYCTGRAHRNAYLFTLGFDSDQIRTDFQELVYWGYATSVPTVCLYILVGIGFGIATTVIWSPEVGKPRSSNGHGCASLSLDALPPLRVHLKLLTCGR